MITDFMVLHGVVNQGHFFELAKIFSDPEKIKQFKSMPDTHCYEIQAANGFNLKYLFKNGSIHIQPASHSTGNIKIIITNLYEKDFRAFGKFFSNMYIINNINSIQKTEEGYFQTWRIQDPNVSIHGMVKNDMIQISSVSPNDLAKAQAESSKSRS